MRIEEWAIESEKSERREVGDRDAIRGKWEIMEEEGEKWRMGYR